MDRKKTESIRCKNCQMLPNEHNYGQYDDLMCELERLPLQLQEAYYRAPRDWDTKYRSYIVYYPMDNLLMLEYEWEKSQTPTPDSLK